MSRGQRRIDRVTDETLPERLPDLPAEAVRELRDDAREEETRLSYLRRVLHGRIDIVEAEVARRRGTADPSGDGEQSEGRDTALLDALPGILADRGTDRREARALGLFDPDEENRGRRAEDALVTDAALTRLPELPDADLAELAERLLATEQDISAQRATVLRHLDALQDELVARYRDGRASIEDVLTPEG